MNVHEENREHITDRAGTLRLDRARAIHLNIMKQIGECAVSAEVWWGKTGIQLACGRHYRFKASGTWCDAKIDCGPDGYDLSRIAAWKRPGFEATAFLRPLNTGRRWYMLVGRLGSSGAAFEISNEIDLTAAISADLYCTVNDIRWAYFNNSGAVVLRVFEI